MKLNEKAAANAGGVLGAAYYVGCYLIATFLPNLYKAVAVSWFHMINITGIWKDRPEGLILGLISFTVFSWVSGWLFASVYNKLNK